MKQTAVESIIKFCEQMANQDLNSHRGAYFNVIKFCKDQAKEMEKQQHKQTWFESTSQFANEAEMLYKKDFEQYYNETLNK